MKRRSFLTYGSIIVGGYSLSGCLELSDDEPDVNITSPSNNNTVSKELILNVNVDKFELRGKNSLETEGEGGRLVGIIGNEKTVGTKIINDENVFDTFGSSNSGLISFSVPGNKTVTAQLVDDNGNALKYSDSINIISEFEINSTIELGLNGNLTIDPSSITIPSGQEVEFLWKVNGINISVVKKPPNSDWNGVPNLQRKGYEHTHVFKTVGEYNYECKPFESTMSGYINVVEDSG